MKTCPNCGNVLPDSFPSCDCGAVLPKTTPRRLDPVDGHKLKIERRVLVGVTIALGLSFLLQLANRGGESPARRWELLDFSVMGILLVCLFVIGVRMRSAIPPSAGGRGMWTLVILFGTLAAIGETVIRLRGSLPPDLNAPKSEDLSLKSRVERFQREQRNRQDAMTLSKWVMEGSASTEEQRRNLTREDLGDFRRKLAAYHQSVDEGLALFEEAKAKDVDVGDYFERRRDADPRGWRGLSEILDVVAKHHDLIDENWAEFSAEGVTPAEGDFNPWQMQVQALERRARAIRERVMTETLSQE